MFQLRGIGHQGGEAAFDFEAKWLGCWRGADHDAADQ
jgi:hypothetical protein